MIQTTKDSASSLATGRIDRERIGSGYRANALMARLSTVPARHDAAERLCKLAERKPTWLYEARSKGKSLPCARLDEAIVDGISGGYITPEILADYFGDLFALYRGMMPGAADATYIDTAREKAEALEATALARAINTPEARAQAVRELAEDVIVSLAHAKQLQRQA